MIARTEAALARPAAPQAAAVQPETGAAAFERALRRLEQPHDEAEDPRPDTTPAAPLQAVGAVPLPHEQAPAPASTPAAPQPVALPQATLQLAAAVAPAEPGAPASAWRLELSATGMPPQQLQVQRTPAGTLQVVLQGAEAPAAQDRLRQRLARRGHDTRFDAPR